MEKTIQILFEFDPKVPNSEKDTRTAHYNTLERFSFTQWRALLYQDIIAPMGLNEVKNNSTRNILLYLAVHYGVYQTTKIVQYVLNTKFHVGLTWDGIPGETTTTAINENNSIILNQGIFDFELSKILDQINYTPYNTTYYKKVLSGLFLVGTLDN